MISDQLFWIISVLLVVEILSQMLQFETIGKVFVQFYVLVIHFLIGVTLASFETKQLVYYFVALIALVNGLRYLFYQMDSVKNRSFVRFIFDLFSLVIIAGIMYVVNLYIAFEQVPFVDEQLKYFVIGTLGLSLLYEMIQRLKGVGLNINHFKPVSNISFFVVFMSVIIGLFILVMPFLDFNLFSAYQLLIVYVPTIIVLQSIIQLIAYNKEQYALLFILPTFISIILFGELILQYII